MRLMVIRTLTNDNGSAYPYSSTQLVGTVKRVYQAETHISDVEEPALRPFMMPGPARPLAPLMTTRRLLR